MVGACPASVWRNDALGPQRDGRLDWGRWGKTTREDADSVLSGSVLHHGNPGLNEITEAGPGCAETRNIFGNIVDKYSTMKYFARYRAWHPFNLLGSRMLLY